MAFLVCMFESDAQGYLGKRNDFGLLVALPYKVRDDDKRNISVTVLAEAF
jgi:hypothetical protein